jgi:signal transduction histidine kinase
VEPAARQRGIRFSRSIHPVTIAAVEDHVTMLVDNIVVNAVNYSRDGTEVEVACGVNEAGEARLTVRDQGIGIPREKLPRIFNDYYRTEEAVQHNRASTGLGLAIVRQVATAAHCGVQVESAPGWGTRFTVTFPRAGLSAP